MTDTVHSLEYKIELLQPSWIDSSGSKLSSKLAFVNIVQIQCQLMITIHKSIIEGLLKMPAQCSLIHGGIEAILAIAMIDGAICNNGNKTLSTRRYSARLTHHKPEIN